MAVSAETTNKLLQGEFKTFEELEEFERNPDFMDSSSIEILYRQLPYDEIQNKTNYVIETIFINE